MAQLDTTGSGTYKATVTAQSVTLVGTGNEKGNNPATSVKATMTVTPTGVTTVVNN